ncbi:MAG: hypothetical protein M3Z85_13160, partial [Acidobacteriota bacterium]|nr:hypothetical protein [Acidobacteriota bacterium]
MLANMDRLSKASSERFFAGADRQMRANLSSFVTWNDVHAFVANLDARLRADPPGDASPAEVRAATAALTLETEAAKTKLASLEAAAKNKFATREEEIRLIGTWFSTLGNLDDLVSFGSQFLTAQAPVPASFLDAAKQAAAIANGLGKMYGDFEVNLARTPDIVVLEAQIQMLEANEDHLKQLALIAARREIDLADTYALIRRVQAGLSYLDGTGKPSGKCSTPGNYRDRSQRITDSLSDATGDQCDLDSMVFVLYNAAALAARGDTPKRLASLRLAEEERRHSIRASAVAARSYEILVATGTQRLANYYKGGIKPETLAQIASALATLGLIPTIAVK